MPALRVALVGAGNIATHHLPAYEQFRDEVELVAVCDLDETLARRRAAEAGIEQVFSDVARMIEEVDCDALDICASPDQHAPIARAAIEAGKHVLVEKPFAHSLAACRELVDAADRAGVTLMVGSEPALPPEPPGGPGDHRLGRARRDPCRGGPTPFSTGAASWRQGTGSTTGHARAAEPSSASASIASTSRAFSWATSGACRQ